MLQLHVKQFGQQTRETHKFQTMTNATRVTQNSRQWYLKSRPGRHYVNVRCAHDTLLLLFLWSYTKAHTVFYKCEKHIFQVRKSDCYFEIQCNQCTPHNSTCDVQVKTTLSWPLIHDKYLDWTWKLLESKQIVSVQIDHNFEYIKVFTNGLEKLLVGLGSKTFWVF